MAILENHRVGVVGEDVLSSVPLISLLEKVYVLQFQDFSLVSEIQCFFRFVRKHVSWEVLKVFIVKNIEKFRLEINLLDALLGVCRILQSLHVGLVHLLVLLAALMEELRLSLRRHCLRCCMIILGLIIAYRLVIKEQSSSSIVE